MIAASVLAFGMIGASGAPAAAAKPTITISKSSGTASSPVRYSYTHQTPKLTGVSSARAKTFASLVSKAMKAEVADLAAWRKGCYAPGDPYMESKGRLHSTVISRAVHGGRYASVMVRVDSNPGCGGVNGNTVFSVNFDLKTGKTVGLGRFARTTTKEGKNTFDPAVIYRLERLKSGCVEPYSLAPRVHGRHASNMIPAPAAWSVSSKGLMVGYGRYAVAAGACGAVTATVPWSDVVRPGSGGTSKITTTRFAGPERYMGVVSVRGTQVAKVSAGAGVPICSLGQRTGTRAVFWNTDVWSVGRSKVGFVKRGSTYVPKPETSRMRYATASDLKQFFPELRSKNAFQICGY